MSQIKEGNKTPVSPPPPANFEEGELARVSELFKKHMEHEAQRRERSTDPSVNPYPDYQKGMSDHE